MKTEDKNLYRQYLNGKHTEEENFLIRNSNYRQSNDCVKCKNCLEYDSGLLFPNDRYYYVCMLTKMSISESHICDLYECEK